MKVTDVLIDDFGSYKSTNFYPADQGLTLISGPTGVGKSTLFDAVPWVLFGVTSKNGLADDIRNWNLTPTQPTTGVVWLEHNGEELAIFRLRGKGHNDLYMKDKSGHEIRGKDITDTQKLINEKLGMDADLYLAGAYFNEFSSTSSFFTTTAKLRRQLTEQLTDLSLARKLGENISIYKKEVKEEKKSLETAAEVLKGKIDNSREAIQHTRSKVSSWKSEQSAKIEKIQFNYENFEQAKQTKIKKIKKDYDNWEDEQVSQQTVYTTNITELEAAILSESYFEENIENCEMLIQRTDKEKCNHCGQAIKSDKKLFYIRQLDEWRQQQQANKQKASELKIAKQSLKLLLTKKNPYGDQLSAEANRENTYAEQLKQAKKETNPYVQIEKEHGEKLQDLQKQLSSLHTDIESFTTEVTDLETLAGLTDDFRGLLIKNMIGSLQSLTNKILADYFDGELRVEFDVQSSDKLEVSITKDGNQCSYAQLSKGQRQLLKLSFGVAVMKTIANHHALSFNAIFMDEFADGLDENLKIKAFRLLEQLATEHESVFAIDHSEALKSMFTRRYNVTMENGYSQLSEA